MGPAVDVLEGIDGADRNIHQWPRNWTYNMGRQSFRFRVVSVFVSYCFQAFRVLKLNTEDDQRMF